MVFAATDLLWTAPELLYKRHAGLNTKKAIQGTQPGDIYSFAIILQEILYRALPYQATGEQTMVTKGQPQALTYLLDDSAINDDHDNDIRRRRRGFSAPDFVLWGKDFPTRGKFSDRLNSAGGMFSLLRPQRHC